MNEKKETEIHKIIREFSTTLSQPFAPIQIKAHAEALAGAALDKSNE